MDKEVFISYSHVDQIIADGVCGYLEQNNILCFIANRDIPKGVTWAKIIPKALRSCKLMIAVFSRDFNLSEETDNEISIAANRHIPILAFRIADEDFDGLKEYYLTKSNWIEAFPEPEKQFGKLLNSVQILLNKTERAPFAPIISKSSDESLDYLNKAKELLSTNGKNKDITRATFLLRKAAKQGNGEAEYLLGMAYYEGLGVSQNWDDAKNWFAKSVEHGYPNAMYQLGFMYHYGIGTEPNIMKALELYTNSQDLGYGKAMKMLGKVYHTGELGVLDENRSQQYYEESFNNLYEQALENDIVEAQYEIANSYMDGEGVPHDYQQAIEWYRRAESNGFAPASNALGVCYCRGMGVHSDLVQGFELQLKSAQNDCRIAQWNTAYNYFHGLGTPIDIKLGYNWMLKAANGGIAPAQCALGKYFASGKNGLEKDLTQSERWYKRAISSGSLDAMYQLGKAYQSSIIEIENPDEESFLLFKKAAMRNHTISYIALGDCYSDKNNTHYNPIESARWFGKIAALYEDMTDNGVHFFVTECGAGYRTFLDFDMEHKKLFASAIKKLASQYERGEGVNKDADEANKWNALASKLS